MGPGGGRFTAGSACGAASAAGGGGIARWEAQPGAQRLFLACPHFEVLFAGTRGGGKTDALLMAFARHAAVFGRAWRGIIFRRTHKQLDDLVTKTHTWFPEFFPKTRFYGSNDKYFWEFPGGAKLAFRRLGDARECDEYQGHAYTFIGWEELTNWPDLKAYELIRACCRTSDANSGLPLMYRATCNPWGIGHNAVKRYFVDAAPAMAPVWTEYRRYLYDKAGKELFDENGKHAYVLDRYARLWINGDIRENRALLSTQTGSLYLAGLEAQSDPNIRKAWLEGSWDITAGGAIDDVWDRDVHVVRPFRIPASWRVDRSFDWGGSHPFSVGWWAESDGTGGGDAPLVPRGTLFRIAEWYGCERGRDNVGIHMDSIDIGRGIAERERDLRVKLGIAKIFPGPADTQIFNWADGGASIADGIFRGAGGAVFTHADKSSGTRIQGLELLRTRLKSALEVPRENPCLFIFDNCRDWLRTVPVLPRDEKKPDDVDDAAEDHAYDDTRYRLLHTRQVVSSQPFSL